MPEDALRVESEEGRLIISLEGPLDQRQVPALWPRLIEALGEARTEEVVIDCRGISGIHSAGLAMLRLADLECERRRLRCSQRNLPPQAAEYRRYAEERIKERREQQPPLEPGFVSHIGFWAREIIDGTVGAITFFGNFLLSVGSVLRRPGRIGVTEILYQMQKAGAEAMPIVLVLSALMGFIVGMQSTTSVANVAPGIFVADAVTMGTMKEMAPLLTAVILVGRSGAAFAAEIGTMQVKEEIAALEVMGFDPMHFLVLPRVIGLALAGPLLTMVADAAGIFGGTIQGYMVVHLLPLDYLIEVSHAMQARFLYEGFIKGFAFALTIGLNGCFHGFGTGTAAESVGVQTTTAVVTGIFFTVFLDAVLAGIFHLFHVG
ncbi:MAG: ABC transporter permease [Desulfobacteraceae bacterium]|nr:ABC transporter permease [Desulfobacteraceae bacterium]